MKPKDWNTDHPLADPGMLALKKQIETLTDARAQAWMVAKNLQADVDIMRGALQKIAADRPDARGVAQEALDEVARLREET